MVDISAGNDLLSSAASGQKSGLALVADMFNEAKKKITDYGKLRATCVFLLATEEVVNAVKFMAPTIQNIREGHTFMQYQGLGTQALLFGVAAVGIYALNRKKYKEERYKRSGYLLLRHGYSSAGKSSSPLVSKYVVPSELLTDAQREARKQAYKDLVERHTASMREFSDAMSASKATKAAAALDA